MKKSPIKSMTGYGRALIESEYGTFTIEVQSLNRRFLEVHTQTPRPLHRFDAKIRLWIKEQIGRGMINVSVSWKREKKGGVHVVPNLELAISLKKGWEEIAHAINLPFEEHFKLSMLAEENEIFEFAEPPIDEAKLLNYLADGVNKAVLELQKMKQTEGDNLLNDIRKRVTSLETLIFKMEKEAPKGPEKYREKLKKRLEELFGANPEIEERISKEVAMMAERSDYTEEAVRFRSHLGQFDKLLREPLKKENETRGKTIEFLLQEFLRELNTIGSKGSSLNISELVVEAKGEVEKIREQVQNVE